MQTFHFACMAARKKGTETAITTRASGGWKRTVTKKESTPRTAESAKTL